MAKTGRRPRAKPAIDRHIRLDQDLDAEVKEHLSDPVTGKLKQGAYSKLVERLLREHIQGKRR